MVGGLGIIFYHENFLENEEGLFKNFLENEEGLFFLFKVEKKKKCSLIPVVNKEKKGYYLLWTSH
jgi:hypothetical protein